MGFVERLPIRYQAQAARVVMRARGLKIEPQGSAYTFDADGLRTIHLAPFEHDAKWSRDYADMSAQWYVKGNDDVRWRMWLLTEFARLMDRPGATFAEFGVYRAGCAYMMLASTSMAKLELFDTFSGIPEDRLSANEREDLLGGERLTNTSADFVRSRLSRWTDRIALHEGDVFDTLDVVETGPLSFVHNDLNATAPTVRCLEYTWDRLIPGGIVVFDDYGYSNMEYREQRAAIDGFLEGRGHVISLPSGQGVVIKSA